MEACSKNTAPFWLAFTGLFVASAFTPVLPFYMGPRGDVFMGMAHVWEFHVILFGIPEWFLLACPVVFTHISISFLTARRFTTLRLDPIQFSLLSLLSASALLAIGLSLVIGYAQDGFCMFFFLCLTAVTGSNYCHCESVVGLPVPRMNRTVLILSTVICGVMIAFGYKLAFERIAV